MSQEELDIMLEICIETINEVIGNNAVYRKIDIKFNKRFTHTLGRCALRGKYATIEISEKYFYHLSTSDDEKYRLILHEVLHSVEDCNNHGTKFNTYAQRIENATGLIGISGAIAKTHDDYDKDVKRKHKWKITCTICGKESSRITRYDSDITDGLIMTYQCKCGGLLRQSKIN